MIAHIREWDKKEQNLKEHLENVSRLCKEFAQQLQFTAMAELIGILHDMGKGTVDFEEYLRWHIAHGEKDILPKGISHHNHAPTGAIYAYERWFFNDDPIQKRVAQIIALCIYGHHTGLMDCIDKNNELHFVECMQQNKDKIRYQEAVDYFLENVAGEAYLDELFAAACEEFKQKKDALLLNQYSFKPGVKSSSRHFQMGMLTRLMLSILIDADRWDSACFEYNREPFAEFVSRPNWEKLIETYEDYAKRTFTGTSSLDRKRQEISDICAEKSKGRPGIYRLSVPTGGGKTFASLRYAMNHAAQNGQQRIFYIIPYNTILDQNAKDIRSALNQYEGILEHHSNVMLDDDSEGERIRYKELTERWDSDIILTSMVQFLNALFRKENTNARRMHRLTNAVLIFDEIQALPRHCKGLFERAITFLTTCCHSTVLLCTATQLELNLPIQPIELMGAEKDLIALNHALKRVEYIPQIAPSRSNQEVASSLASLFDEASSVLMIVNTKAVAWDIYEKTCEILREDGYEPIVIESDLTDNEIRERARNAEEFEILCIHLSTLLCPEHRKEYLRWIRNWTRNGGRALCVSTALVEAGINISFPVVVRSLASLPSIVQAAGRCNRNMEHNLGKVYIWKLAEENLKKLPEIAQGQAISADMINDWLREYEDYNSLSDPEGIQIYFRKEARYTKDKEQYPMEKNKGVTLVELLSDNSTRAKGIRKQDKMPIGQSFREAGEAFEVIPQKTKPVIVPYGKGEELITQLNGDHTMGEEIRLLRQAQQYCVNVYDNMYRRLAEEEALYRVGSSEVVVLKKEYYSDESGVKTRAGELEEMIF